MKFLPFRHILFCTILISLIRSEISAQESPGHTRRAVVHEGDTIPYIELPMIRYFSPRVFANRREEVRYTRLVHNVKRVYPYARLAGIKFREYNELLAGIQSETQRKKITKEIEKQIKDEFEGELKRLTFTQGHILIKLIDRETSHSSYDVLKDFRGTLTAVFWQSFGRIFGYNLKNKYDPEGEDKLIEEIVRLIENGAI
jgi:hypothetical protein